jgi:hypothetical protein
MYLVQQFTSDAAQKTTLVLPDGSQLSMQIYFRPMQLGWFIDNLTYGSFVLNGLRITNSPNMLNQFRNQIPFGLACYSTDNREPSQASDFSSGASKLYLLTQAEATAYAEFLANG